MRDGPQRRRRPEDSTDVCEKCQMSRETFDGICPRCALIAADVEVMAKRYVQRRDLQTGQKLPKWAREEVEAYDHQREATAAAIAAKEGVENL